LAGIYRQVFGIKEIKGMAHDFVFVPHKKPAAAAAAADTVADAVADIADAAADTAAADAMGKHHLRWVGGVLSKHAMCTCHRCMPAAGSDACVIIRSIFGVVVLHGVDGCSRILNVDGCQ
jgi:hypothetical protein